MIIPWGQIISASVTMADVAHSLYKKSKKETKVDDANTGSAQALQDRVARLESIQSEQSALLQLMTIQNRALIRKVRNAYIMTALALCISIALAAAYAFGTAL